DNDAEREGTVFCGAGAANVEEDHDLEVFLDASPRSQAFGSHWVRFTLSGTATPGVDYELARELRRSLDPPLKRNGSRGQLWMNSSVSPPGLLVTVVDDEIDEADETIVITLEAGAGSSTYDVGEPATLTLTVTGSESASESESDGETESETESQTDSETESESESEGEAESETDNKNDIDGESETEDESETDGESETGDESETETEGESNELTPALTLSPATLTLTEGTAASYTVALATQPADPVTVSIAGHAGAGLDLDRASLTFSPSDWDQPQTVTVSAHRDADAATLTHTASGGGYGSVAAALPVTVRAGIRISVAAGEAMEGSLMKVRFRLSSPSPGDVEVSWGTHPGSAHAGPVDDPTDFRMESGRLRFAEGERELTREVWIVEDGIDDPHEQFTVDIYDPVGAILATPVTSRPSLARPDEMVDLGRELAYVVVTIRQAAPPPDPVEVTLEADPPTLEEGGRTLVRARLAEPLPEPVRIPLVWSAGSAEPDDYEGPSGLTIYAGDVSWTVTLTAAEDADADDETLRVSFGELPAQVVAGSPASIEITILDNDGDGEDFSGLTVSAADASAREGEENLRFAVTLNRPAPGPVTVQTRLEPGTARRGADYVDAYGPVRFAAGERVQFVTVLVEDDLVDEGEETLYLELREPQPDAVTIARARATGTIINTDPMPAAWLARFGRTVAAQALDGVSARLTAARAPGWRGTIGGVVIGAGTSQAGGVGETPDPVAAEALLRLDAGASTAGGQQTGCWPPATAGAPGTSCRGRALDGLTALAGTDFSVTRAPNAHGGTLAFWSRGAHTTFGGRAGSLDLDGEVATGLLGADYAQGRWQVGLALAQSRGDGAFTDPAVGSGEVESSLTAALPYASFSASERFSLWAAAGYGMGEVTLETEAGTALDAGTGWAMAAAGGRGDLVAPAAHGGAALALVSDALWARTSSEQTLDVVATGADVTRLRLGLEGSWSLLLAGGGELAPRLETGLRHDAGDAETGFGVELGGGFAWTDPRLGLSLDLAARTLLAHEAAGRTDRGLSVAFAFDPDPGSARGLSLSLKRDLGAATGGLDALFSHEPLGRRAAPDASGRWGAEAAYGLPVFGDRFTGSPQVGYARAGATREYRLGWRLEPARPDAPELMLRLELSRREEGAGSTEHGIGLDLNARW
ncbi:MAG: hypothetical protein F4147_10440, partial [Gammaproteobacteria bacterium]|nr:hypothetical protein [Gammaproteobacteria bacterium]